MKNLCMAVALTIVIAMGCYASAAAQEAQAPPADKPAYIGVAKCSVCHKSEKKGNQLGQWQSTKHAKAYATLATPEAKALAKAKGIEDPQKSNKCLKCHVTGFGADPKLFEASFKVEEGVQCEACHGPGSLYKPVKVMKDRAASIKAGLIIPDEKTCVKCHNAESPSYKKFVFKEMYPKIAHPIPAEAKGKE